MTILEPCCKHMQFTQLLQNLKKGISDSFIYYGDVALPEWFTTILLETKGADVFLRLKTLDIATLNYLLNRMRDYAFIPGARTNMLNHVTIVAHTLPETMPQRAEVLQEEGRLVIKKMQRTAKYEVIDFTPNKEHQQKSIVNPLLPKCKIRLSGNFFAEQPNEPRNVNIKIL